MKGHLCLQLFRFVTPMSPSRVIATIPSVCAVGTARRAFPFACTTSSEPIFSVHRLSFRQRRQSPTSPWTEETDLLWRCVVQWRQPPPSWESNNGHWHPHPSPRWGAYAPAGGASASILNLLAAPPNLHLNMVAVVYSDDDAGYAPQSHRRSGHITIKTAVIIFISDDPGAAGTASTAATTIAPDTRRKSTFPVRCLLTCTVLWRPGGSFRAAIRFFAPTSACVNSSYPSSCSPPRFCYPVPAHPRTRLLDSFWRRTRTHCYMLAALAPHDYATMHCEGLLQSSLTLCAVLHACASLIHMCSPSSLELLSSIFFFALVQSVDNIIHPLFVSSPNF